MRLDLDVEKSIEMRRLIPSSWYAKIFDYVNYSFFATVFIICIIGPTIGIPIKIDTLDIVMISLVLAVLFIVFIVLYKMDKLTVIENHNLKLDKSFFIKLAEENKWSSIKESDNILMFNSNNWFFHERQVTILLKNKFIFINVLSFGKYDIKSPIYMRKDREILNRIIEKIEITIHNKGLA